MDQILHVFRKDVRRHWPEIVLSIAILTAFAWNEPSQWMPQRSRESILRVLLHQWLSPMVAIGWLFLIVRVVHGESLVGDRQFWVTRPYQWKKLLIAKVMFIAVSVNLPLFVVQMSLLWKGGFAPARYVRGLLWMQFLWVMLLILPMTTISAVTSGLGQTVLVLLGVLLSLIGLAALSSAIPDIGLPLAQRIPEWFQPTILLGACVVVILRQYAWRRTLHSRSLLAVAAAIVLVTMTMTPRQSFDAHAYPQISSGQQLPVQLTFDPVKSTAAGGAQIDKNKVEIQVPLLVSGIERDSVVVVDGMSVEIETPGGLHWNSGWFGSSLSLLPAQTHADAAFRIDRAFFDQVKSSSAKVHISFALTAFQAKETRRITVGGGEFTAPGNAWCSIYPEISGLQCRSPLKSPFLLVTTLSEESTCPLQENERTATPGTIFSALNRSWGAAPAEFGISPVQTFSLPFSVWRTNQEFRARLCPGTPLVFGLPEESQRTRSELTIEGIRLIDYQLKNFWSGGTAFGIAAH